MKTARYLDKNDFNALVDACNIVHSTVSEIKVLQHKGTGNYIKLFRKQNIFSTDFFYPYAKRFIHASEKLQQLGIVTVNVMELAFYKPEKRYLITYEGIPGDSIRHHLKQGSLTQQNIEKLALYIHTLHEKGIYFRALHFGNIIKVSAQQFGLVDIANVLFYKKPLSFHHRLRNMKHLVRALSRDKLDSKYLSPTLYNALMTCYLQQQSFSHKQINKFITQLNIVASKAKHSDKFFQIAPLENI